MPTPVGVARQCLTAEAARALDEAVSVARRRGHAQTTSLHAVSALLSLPSSSVLRDACSRARNSAYSPRLQFKALDLCLSVSLDRAPSSHNNLSSDHEPPVSNSLMAAIKRSQANQRRHPDNFHLYHNHPQQLQQLQQPQQPQQQQQQPFSVSSVKVELQHLILSILDDPVVSRVFAEAGFRSSEIKLAILRPLPHLFRSRGPPIFLCNLPDQPRRSFSFPFFSGFGEKEVKEEDEEEVDVNNFRRIGEVLVRSRGRNPLLLGACANDALRRFTEAVEKMKGGVLPLELCGLRVVCIGKEMENLDGDVLGSRLKEVALMAEKSVGPGLVVSFGDLKGFLNDGCVNKVRLVVGELAKLLQLHYDKFWLLGAAASYESYLKFVGRFPSIEKDWDLQLLPITSVRASSLHAESYQRPRSSLMDSFVPFGGFFPSQSDLKGPLNGSLYCVPHCHQYGERCEHEVLAASKERFTASAAEPYQPNLPPWLQIAEFGTTKGLNVKTKDDGVLLDSSESGPPHKNSEKTCQHLHQRSPDANTCPTVVGFHCTDNKKEDADNRSSKIREKSPSECIDLNSHVPVDVQMMSTSQSSSPFPAVFKEKQEKYTSKLTDMFQKVDDLESGDGRSCNLSNSSVCDGSQMSPTSVTSVTTDLGLGICSSPTSNKSNKPPVQYTMEPPKEIPSRFSSNFNSADGNILKHPSQSSSCLSFDHCGQVDARNPRILFEALSKEVSWQDEALRVIVKTVVYSPTKRVKHHRANQRGDIWMNFVGPDRHGKKKIAVSLAELFFGSRESFIFVDLSSEEMKGCNVKFRGKTTLDFIVGECCKKPLSVVFLENVDKADVVAQSSLSQAIKTGKITDSHGREVSVNSTIFVTSFSGYQNSSMPTRGEPSNYSEERILRAKGGAIKIKVEHVIGDIRSQTISVVNSSIGAIPNLIFMNKRKLIGEHEFHDPHLLSDTAKRAHTTSSWLLDLNLPAEENEPKQTDDGNSEHVSTENQNLWLQDLYNLVDETVVFKPYDFDALADRVLKVIRSNFKQILGSECSLQIQSEVMDQLLAAAYVSDRDMVVENWVEQVLCGGFTEVRRRYNLTASSIVKLETCPQQASYVHLPPRIILD
ncbi:protein SMAX1-LIKE 8-like [Gastrolobium bilobum]|uniref:protein SMAX1-LIKE 8-like n=1 Tax=Gastrolobium bilobum TaxID=150636 RepID=UPI002AB28614|nr:protein SMAX1-LIKE 8-like [Gastrolobium bilobum]